MVPDGAGAQTLPVARRIAFRDDRVRDGAFDGAGVLDCSGDAVLLLASVSAAPGLPRDAAARVCDDAFGRHGDLSAVCCVASASAGGYPAAKVEKYSTNDSRHHARGTGDGVHPFSLFSWCEPGIAVRPEHGHRWITGGCKALGSYGLSIGGLPAPRGFD